MAGVPLAVYMTRRVNFYQVANNCPLPTLWHSVQRSPNFYAQWEQDNEGGFLIYVWLPPFGRYPPYYPDQPNMQEPAVPAQPLVNGHLSPSGSSSNSRTTLKNFILFA